MTTVIAGLIGLAVVLSIIVVTLGAVAIAAICGYRRHRRRPPWKRIP